MNYKKKKKELEIEYNELEKKKVALLGGVKEIEVEQLRLQGEYRLLGKLEKKK